MFTLVNFILDLVQWKHATNVKKMMLPCQLGTIQKALKTQDYIINYLIIFNKMY